MVTTFVDGFQYLWQNQLSTMELNIIEQCRKTSLTVKYFNRTCILRRTTRWWIPLMIRLLLLHNLCSDHFVRSLIKVKSIWTQAWLALLWKQFRPHRLREVTVGRQPAAPADHLWTFVWRFYPRYLTSVWCTLLYGLDRHLERIALQCLKK